MSNSYAHLPAVSNVVFKALGTVMAEPIVVAYQQLAHIEMLFQYALHEHLCREGSHVGAEGQDDTTVYACQFKQPDLLCQRCEQLGLIVFMQHLARMAVEGDDHRLHTGLFGCLAHLLQDELMASVYAVEEAYGGHLRRSEVYV